MNADVQTAGALEISSSPAARSASINSGMLPMTLFAVVLLIAIAIYAFSGRKALRAPGLREALFIIGTLIVLFVIWLTMMR